MSKSTIDKERRWIRMQQPAGQPFALRRAAARSVRCAERSSFHSGAESCTPSTLPPSLEPEQLRPAERRANQVVVENRPVTIGFQHSSEDLGLRKPTGREGEVRIISIQDLDRSACGGTHVRATGEIGPILLRKLDRIQGNLRIEDFVHGGRAVAHRARSDFEALSHIARVFSSSLDDTPAMVDTQREKLQESDRTRRSLAIRRTHAEPASRALYAGTEPGPDGIRRMLRQVDSLTEDSRVEAQSFTSLGAAHFPSRRSKPGFRFARGIPKAPFTPGNLLKPALTNAGGRGGGNAVLAQGSLPSTEALDQLVRLHGRRA